MSFLKIIIPGKLSGLNEYINACRRNRFIGAKLKASEQAKCYMPIMYQSHGKRFECAVNVTFDYYESDKRRDKDNVTGWAHKVIFDALVSAKVIQDDGWKCVGDTLDRFHIDSKRPRIEITLEEA